MSLLSTANEWGEAALGSLPFGSVLVKAKQSGARLLDTAWEKITGTRGLKKDVADAAAELIAAWNENYRESTGWTVYIFEGKRTKDRQAKLVEQGRSLTMNSRHLTGDAVDIWFKDENGDPVPPDEVPPTYYEALGELGEEIGFTWGGRWTSLVDKPHFEA